MKIDRQKAIDWLEDKWKGSRVCPICGNDDWGVPDQVFEVRAFLGGGLAVGEGGLVPLFLILCDNCGYTITFNAIAMGLVVKSEPQEEPAHERK